MTLSKASIQKIRESGLFIDDNPDFVETHVAYPNGYIVIKPSSINGNCLPDYEAWYNDHDGKEKMSDAPRIVIYPRSELWHVTVSDYVPGPGPGDFDIHFNSEEEAVDNILNYYFRYNKYFNEYYEASING